MPYPAYLDQTSNITSLRSFIGMVKYLRRYIKYCAKFCSVLNGLLCNDSDLLWKQRHQEAWGSLVKAVVENVGIHHPNFHHPIYVCTDGSKIGIGRYLYQLIDGEERIVSFYSRSTTKAELRGYAARALKHSHDTRFRFECVSQSRADAVLFLSSPVSWASCRVQRTIDVEECGSALANLVQLTRRSSQRLHCQQLRAAVCCLGAVGCGDHAEPPARSCQRQAHFAFRTRVSPVPPVHAQSR